MSLNRKGSWLAAWVVMLLAAGSALAQSEGIRDAQLAAPADFDQFGGGTRANEGFFFNYNGLFWNVSSPKTAYFGVDVGAVSPAYVYWGIEPGAPFPQGVTTTAATSTMNTSFISGTDSWTGGTEISLGYVEDHQGVGFTYWNLHGVSNYSTQNDVSVFFNDQPTGAASIPHLDGLVGYDPVTGQPILGRTPVFFDSVFMWDYIRMSGASLEYIYRTEATQSGGVFEWSVGAKYVELREVFQIQAGFTTNGGIPAQPITPPPGTFIVVPPGGAPNYFDGTNLFDLAYNRIVGSEIALRWTLRSDRWTWMVRGGFTPGVDFQSVRQSGVLADNIDAYYGPPPRLTGAPIAMQSTSFDNVIHPTTFCPIVDVRLELKYNVTRNIAANVGWAGVWMDNIARPASMNDYTLHSNGTVMGFLSGQNQQQLWMTGVTAGVEINR